MSRQNEKESKKKRKLNLNSCAVIIGIIVSITVIFSFLLDFPIKFIEIIKIFSAPTSTPTPQVSDSLFPTPIPRGPLLTGINFNEIGDGHCDTSRPDIYGYESHQYYIKSPSTSGYIIECNTGIWGPQGSLEVEAYAEGDISFFGYAVIIGWQSNGAGKTDDACIFGVIRRSGNPPTIRVIVQQRINRVTDTPSSNKININLDNKSHKIRLVMLTDSNAIGYFDDQYIGEYNFRECPKGRIGLVAWGTGETKIYFDNFNFHSLP